MGMVSVLLVHGRASDRLKETYFDGMRETRAAAQAYDPGARRMLRELSARLSVEPA
jgi:hypothetical protein